MDITGEYARYLETGDAEKYVSSCPEVFCHYFEFWAKRERFRPTLTAGETKDRVRLIASRLSRVEKAIRRAGFNCRRVKVFLFVGADTTNGHAFRYRNRFEVFLPVESYTTACRVDVFLAHEVFHALHYAARREFYFEDEKEMLSVSRRLITEGLATYLSKLALGVSDEAALFADYISESQASKLIAAYAERREDLSRFIVEKYRSRDREIGIFYAQDPEDVFRYKSGYYIGMKLVEAVAQDQGLNGIDLLRMPRPRFERLALEKMGS